VPVHINGNLQEGTVDIKGLGTVQEGMPHKCDHGKMKKSTVLPSMLLAWLWTSKLRARSLSRGEKCALRVVSTPPVEIAS
jgi:hypothetical protein